MLIDVKEYEQIENDLCEWEKIDIATREVVKVVKELLSALKRSDKKGFDTITAVILYVIKTIMEGPDQVNDLFNYLYNEDFEDMPGPGETAMKNEDGSYVTLKELGIE